MTPCGSTLHRAKMSASRRFCLPLAALQLCLVALGQKEPRAKPADTARLVDITASTGIHFDHLSSPEARYIVESMSGGVAIIDFEPSSLELEDLDNRRWRHPNERGA